MQSETVLGTSAFLVHSFCVLITVRLVLIIVRTVSLTLCFCFFFACYRIGVLQKL